MLPIITFNLGFLRVRTELVEPSVLVHDEPTLVGQFRSQALGHQGLLPTSAGEALPRLSPILPEMLHWHGQRLERHYCVGSS